MKHNIVKIIGLPALEFELREAERINNTKIIWVVRYIKSKMIIQAYDNQTDAELYITSNYDNSMVLEVVTVKLISKN